MKPITFLSILLLAIGSFSCKKLLDTKPQDFLSPQNYYETEIQLNNALNGVYDPLGWNETYGYYYWARLTVATDESFFNNNSPSAIITGMAVNKTDAFDPEIRLFWRAMYQGIDRANRLLENIQKPAMDDIKRKQIEGEAKFLRGYYYYLLVSNFGDVPLVLSSTTSVANTDVARTSIKNVYAQILADMTDAESKVATITSLGFGGRVSKTAVEGILARVCLTMAGYPLKDQTKYTDAYNWANKVVVSGEHSLIPDYRQIFINYAQDLYNIRESIWEVEFWGNIVSNQYRETGRLGNLNGITYTVNNSAIGYTYGFVNTTATHFNQYAAKDTIRRNWNIASFSYNTAGAKVAKSATDIYSRNCGKWRREYETYLPKSNSGTPQNFPLLRYADVLLMLAEADNEVNGGPTAVAYSAINQVRARAYGKLLPGATNLTEGDLPTGLSQEQFRAKIQTERMLELSFEALRRSDLIRWGMYVPIMKTVANEITLNAPATYKYAANPGINVTDKYVLFPIPQTEIAVNGLLTQNTGW